jgi:hypothetical protein
MIPRQFSQCAIKASSTCSRFILLYTICYLGLIEKVVQLFPGPFHHFIEE